MHKPGTLARKHSLPTFLINTAMGCLLLSVTACAGRAPEPVLGTLPEVSAQSAATLTLRSKNNFSDVKHRHVLTINGIAAGVFREEDIKSFQLAEGTHKLELSCHTRYMRGDNVFPFNYTVADDKTALDLELLAGDAICLKISFNPLQCAILQESAPSYCE